MFNTLEADIVVMQELKIQRKDLRDDMVLVPGWDVYFSLPKLKKGIVYRASSVSTIISLLTLQQAIPASQYILGTQPVRQYAPRKASLVY